MSRWRFLVDESLPNSLADGLRRHIAGVEVRQIGDADAPVIRASDPDLLDFCERARLLLITANRATMPDFVTQHLGRGAHTRSVFVIGPDRSLSLILDELSIVYETSDDSEWTDVLEYLPFAR